MCTVWNGPKTPEKTWSTSNGQQHERQTSAMIRVNYHPLLFSSKFWILCTIESINQSIGYHTLLLSSEFWILCTTESINQSIGYHTLLFSSEFWILCATINQSINRLPHFAIFQWILDFVCYYQSINQSATTLCCFPVNSGFCVLLNQSINQSATTLCCFPVNSGFCVLLSINQLNRSMMQCEFLFLKKFQM